MSVLILEEGMTLKMYTQQYGLLLIFIGILVVLCGLIAYLTYAIYYRTWREVQFVKCREARQLVLFGIPLPSLGVGLYLCAEQLWLDMVFTFLLLVFLFASLFKMSALCSTEIW